MGNPITWRNVGATTSSAGVGGLLQGAQASFDQGIGALDKVLQQAKTTQQANWDQGKENNTNQVMNGAMAIQDPEELARAQATGQFQQMMAGMGAQVDQAAVRNFLDTRGGVLQERAIANQGYQDHNTRVGQRELEAQIYQRAHAGDIQGAQALAGQLQIDQRDHLSGITDLRRGFESDRRDDTRLGYEGQRVSLEGQRVALSQNEFNARQAQAQQATQRQQQMQGLLQSALNSGLSGPQSKQALQEQMFQMGYAPNDINDATRLHDALMEGRTLPTASDTLRMEEATQALDRAFAGVRNNSYVAGMMDNRAPTEKTNGVIDWARSSGIMDQVGWFWEGEKDAVRDITKVFHTGFNYRDPETREFVNVPVSEEDMRAALSARGDSWGGIRSPGTTRDINNLLQEYFDAIGFSQQIQEGQEYLNARQQLQQGQQRYLRGQQ